MLIKTGKDGRNLGLQTQADVDIGSIMDILDSVRMMGREMNMYSKIN